MFLGVLCTRVLTHIFGKDNTCYLEEALHLYTLLQKKKSNFLLMAYCI